MATNEQVFEKRVRQLELYNRILITAVLGLAALGILAFTTDDDSVSAHAFELISADGSQRASLRLEDGNPVFTLNDEDGSARLKIFHEPDMTGMYVLDAENTPRIGIAQFAHGGGGVALHGPQSKGAAVLYLQGEGSLRFFDSDGAVTARMPPLDDTGAK